MKYLYNLFLLLLFCSMIFSEEAIKYSKLPEISKSDLVNFKGETVNFDDLYKDGPLLLSFWFLGCGPCIMEMKHLSKFNEKYNESGFKVISISTDTKSKGKVKSFVKSQKYVFTVLSDPRAVLFRKMGGKVMPYVIIADSTGEVINRHVGYNPGDEKKLEKEIINLLQSNVEDSTKVKEKKIEPLLDIPPTASDSTIKSLD